ncbi:hypothetical protein [Rosistilla oblonga]|uniref:hypothetical protein n=1 Tax=Rosistilla oblonga TaxID=2527990 RepID=UPI003A977433
MVTQTVDPKQALSEAIDECRTGEMFYRTNLLSYASLWGGIVLAHHHASLNPEDEKACSFEVSRSKLEIICEMNPTTMTFRDKRSSIAGMIDAWANKRVATVLLSALCHFEQEERLFSTTVDGLDSEQWFSEVYEGKRDVGRFVTVRVVPA